ncbi:TolC family outer membrane protein [Sphingomonas sp. HITSZ_GF]|uniref:TolC family outer membrane protein n=1 Tax=Sphingomonas sp. HITSZ_GF TaxID=3037247 RepID=UPI00240D10A3|nr:TolC family outer membrane protein [Sphingomonas sp. HITSZ_GF]MDG2532844.1 TolC family outer membrane protein [Sphingomonas sp. HITSZ_GF]
MRISSLFLGASLAAIAMPAAAQTTTTRDGTQAPVRVEVGSAAPAQTAQPTTTLRDALVLAYNTNPGLQSDRADQRANDENVPIAKAAGRPGLSGTGSASTSPYDSDATIGPTRTGTVGLNLSVPIYTGGAVRNSVRGAETRVEAGLASLRGAEAQLFTDAVTAYVDVLRFEAIVRLNQQNVHVLEVNLQATRDRFEVGDLTRTDVAQSEARLALAQSQLRTAEAALIGARENYIRVIGAPPGVLAQPPALPGIPTDVQDAEQAALANNPNLEAAQKQRDATRFDVSAAKASRMPTVSVGVGTNYYNYLGSLSSQARSVTGLSPDGVSTTVGAQVNLPLFQGGRPAAQIRQAQAREASAMETVTLTERGVIAQVRSAYANYSSALRVIESTRVAVEANRLSLEGVRAENSVGTRTILDILNAEQELLNSQVNYVTAERDAYVAGFQLLAAMGRAEANDLNLDGGPLYDPGVNYKRVKNRWSDWSNDPAPEAVGTSTKATPAQNPDVTNTALDPVLQRGDATAPVDINRKKP